MESFALGRSRRPASARRPAPASRASAAFTLLELLIAIAIIGILASLILTVAGSAYSRARITQVSVDIQDLAKGIAAFKQKFGVEPPSHITLYEQASGWNGDPRSMGLIRQIWPQFDFTYAATSGAVDINGNGTSNDVIFLSGSECLVFFLGGMPALNTPNGGGAPTGFSQNPASPFTLGGSNRDRFMEFDTSRLLLYPPANQTVSGILHHSINAYRDPIPNQQQPYLYFSSYNGQGYDITNELPAGPGSPGTFADVYRQGPNGATSASPSPPWNANSYQIISPGFDGASDLTYGGFGIGGQYDPNTAGSMLVGPAPTGRGPERDNITNFSSATLAP
ncbi:MAG TPA: prepilin-type N-terminal cleavage/methylation domain-containing protein [Planctomycetaceae bacterium]|jgi:prepilin-type N-terminal cleavage/methylation domain-containing protein|nr:prepilin-type N-terminal cleavage/methylation domain-containing protein [Planctomycetaceae bacterium]